MHIFIAIFLALLIVILYPVWYPYFEKEVNKLHTKDLSSNFIFKDIQKENTDEITIEGFKETINLQKTASGWILGSNKASQTQIDNFFSALRKLEVGDLLSKNPNNHLELGVTAQTGYVLTVRRGAVKYSVLIGNPSSIEDAFYIRPIDKDNVYLAKGDLRNIVIQDKTNWLDKAIIDIKFDEVHKIDVLSASPYTIVKNEDGILIKTNQGVDSMLDSEKTKKLKTMFSPLIGDKFLSETQKQEFLNAKFKNVIVFLDKEDQMIASLDVLKNKDTYWVAESGSQDVFEVNNLSLMFEL